MIPGRILIVDDKKGEVQALIDQFLERGEHVVYSGLPVKSDYYNNIRLLILDYWLDEENEKNSLQNITTIINEISKKSKFFMIVIWSVRVSEKEKKEYRRKIVSIYKKRFVQDIPGLLLEPIGKEELDYLKLIQKIEAEIASFPDVSLLYEIERIVDRAKDVAKTRIYDTGNWSNLIKNLSKEFDADSVGRQMLNIYVNILKRNVESTERLGECISKVIGLSEPFSVSDFGRVYSAQYYHELSDEEQISTGDILFDNENKQHWIIITPECDITNNKHTAVKLVEAVRIDHLELQKRERLKQISQLCYIESGKAIEAILRGKGMRTNFCSLAFLMDYQKKEFFHLIFDFNKVKFVKKVRKIHELGNYSRICRVDSPMINSFIQKYVSFCLRFGTMSIPKEVSDELKAKLAEQKQAEKA